MDKVIIIDGIDVSGCEFYSATGQCKIQQVFQRNEIVGIIEKPYGVHLECNLCNKDCYYKQLQRAKAELKKYEDMAKKGLEEFKDVGGCWGCGLQLQLNQDMEDIKKLKAENERLKKEIKYLEEEKKEKIQLLEQIINILYPNANDDELFTITFNSEYIDKLKKYRQALQEIRDIAERQLLITNVRTYQMVYYADFFQYRNEILAKINEVIGVE